MKKEMKENISIEQISVEKVILAKFKIFLDYIDKYKIGKDKDLYLALAFSEIRGLEERVYHSIKDNETKLKEFNNLLRAVFEYDGDDIKAVYKAMSNITHLNMFELDSENIKLNVGFSVRGLILFTSYCCRESLDQLKVEHPGKKIQKILKEYNFKPKYGKKKKVEKKLHKLSSSGEASYKE